MEEHVLKYHLILFIQHDPEDEPVAPPLDPEFFEFDRAFSPVFEQGVCALTRLFPSAQG